MKSPRKGLSVEEHGDRNGDRRAREGGSRRDGGQRGKSELTKSSSDDGPKESVTAGFLPDRPMLYAKENTRGDRRDQYGILGRKEGRKESSP